MFSSDLDRAILEIIVYFDLFSYPLTTLEISENLSSGAKIEEVRRALYGSTWLNSRLDTQNGMWFLKGREVCVIERQKRYRASKHKIDIVRRFVGFARFIPWIQRIFACNSLGFLNARQESDIDLFIVTRRGRIWSTRFFTVMLAKLFGRPTPAHTKDALCLSFFAVEGANMKKAALGQDDVYFRNWLMHLLPLYERKEVKHAGMGVGNFFERILRAVQLKIMPAHLRSMANKGTGVVITDEFLKFHDHDRREQFRTKYEEKLAAVAG